MVAPGIARRDLSPCQVPTQSPPLTRFCRQRQSRLLSSRSRVDVALPIVCNEQTAAAIAEELQDGLVGSLRELSCQQWTFVTQNRVAQCQAGSTTRVWHCF